MNYKNISYDEINRKWELHREHYLTPAELSELAGGYDVSGIYKKIRNKTLPCVEVNGVKKIFMNDIESQSFVYDNLTRYAETINPIEIDKATGQKIKSRSFLELFALIETSARFCNSLRIFISKPDQDTAPGFTRFQILRMNFADVIQNINAGLLELDQVIKIMQLDEDEIQTHKEVFEGLREAKLHQRAV